MTDTTTATAIPQRGKVIDHPSVGQSLTARRARPKWRHRAAAVSFALCVVVPTALTVGYLYLRAADQYASSVAFSVRGAEQTPTAGILSALAPGFSSGGLDAEIIYEFVRSQQMVEAALEPLALETMFNRPEDDFIFHLGEARPIEDIVDYWNRMTDVSFDGGSGLVRFEARAFTPQDAEAISAFVLAESTRIVNTLSQQAREDAISVAREAVAEAEERLRGARRAMRQFRDSAQELDPSENARAALELVATLEGELARTRIDLNSQQSLVGARSPRIAPLRQHIASLEKQIAEERARLGAGDAVASGSRLLSGAITDYEELQVDLEFAQNAYVSTLAAFEQAQIEARRQSRFLTPHISPTLSVEAQYPQRAMMSVAMFGILASAWAVCLLIAYNIRDRR